MASLAGAAPLEVHQQDRLECGKHHGAGARAQCQHLAALLRQPAGPVEGSESGQEGAEQLPHQGCTDSARPAR